MNDSHARFRRRTAALAVLVLVFGCSDNPLAPFSPEINNATDSFQFQVTGLTGITDVVEYTWENTGTSANVDRSSNITSGSAQLAILDADGTQVYRESLVAGGSTSTDPGVAGNWTIRVELSGTEGMLNFRVQKP